MNEFTFRADVPPLPPHGDRWIGLYVHGAAICLAVPGHWAACIGSYSGGPPNAQELDVLYDMVALRLGYELERTTCP